MWILKNYFNHLKHIYKIFIGCFAIVAFTQPVGANPSSAVCSRISPPLQTSCRESLLVFVFLSYCFLDLYLKLVFFYLNEVNRYKLHMISGNLHIILGHRLSSCISFAEISGYSCRTAT